MSFLCHLAIKDRHSDRIVQEKWNRDIELMLGFIELDIALLESKPVASKDCSSIATRVKFKKQESPNRLSLMMIK